MEKVSKEQTLKQVILNFFKEHPITFETDADKLKTDLTMFFTVPILAKYAKDALNGLLHPVVITNEIINVFEGLNIDDPTIYNIVSLYENYNETYKIAKVCNDAWKLLLKYLNKWKQAIPAMEKGLKDLAQDGIYTGSDMQTVHKTTKLLEHTLSVFRKLVDDKRKYQPPENVHWGLKKPMINKNLNVKHHKQYAFVGAHNEAYRILNEHCPYVKGQWDQDTGRNIKIELCRRIAELVKVIYPVIFPESVATISKRIKSNLDRQT